MIFVEQVEETCRVPAFASGEAFGVASRVITGGDIVDASDACRIEPGIQESQRGFALGDLVVVEEGHETSNSRGRCAGSANEECLVTNDDKELFALRGEVGVSSSGCAVR